MDNVEWLSPSSISTYLQCPLKFKYEKIDKAPWTDNEATLRGSYAHRILEVLYERAPEDRNFDTARAIARDTWPEFEEKVIAVIGSNPEVLRKFRWSVWWCVDNYFKLEDPQAISPIGLETWVRGEINGAKVRGIIDRLDPLEDGIAIRDYKTGKKPARAEWAQDYVFQLSVYGILSERSEKKPVKEMSLLYLKNGERSDYDLSPKRRKSTEKTIKTVRTGIDERVAAEEFEYRTSKLCDWCDFKSQCPAWS